MINSNDDPSYSVVSIFPIPINNKEVIVPRELTILEINGYIQPHVVVVAKVINEANYGLRMVIFLINSCKASVIISRMSMVDRVDEVDGDRCLCWRWSERLLVSSRQFRRSVSGYLPGVHLPVSQRLVRPVRAQLGLTPSIEIGMGMDCPIPQFTHIVSTLKDVLPSPTYTSTLSNLESRATKIAV